MDVTVIKINIIVAEVNIENDTFFSLQDIKYCDSPYTTTSFHLTESSDES